jgi:hypothetical protein
MQPCNPLPAHQVFYRPFGGADWKPFRNVLSRAGTPINRSPKARDRLGRGPRQAWKANTPTVRVSKAAIAYPVIGQKL